MQFELWMDFSQSFVSLWNLPSHAKVCSTTQRHGSTLKRFWSSQRMATSMVQSPLLMLVMAHLWSVCIGTQYMP